MRYIFIRHVLIVCFFALNIIAYSQERPNVVLIISDDLNTSLSGFGHPQCKTPNLDKLAERGMKFNNMYCQNPLCGPSRAAIMSGLYPYTTQFVTNSDHVRDHLPDLITLPQLFRLNGYRVGRVSKVYHMGIPNEIVAGETKHDDPVSWDEVVNIKCAEVNGPGKVTNWSPGVKNGQAFWGLVGTEGDASYADGMAADEAIKMMDRMKDEPFFLAVGFVRPHVPLIAPEKYYNLYDREEMDIPYTPTDDLSDVPDVVKNYKTKVKYGIATSELHKGLLKAYYASVSYMDAQVGRVLKALEEKGLAENTIVVFTSDHGYLLGHHNKFQKQHLFEETTKVPFIVSVPWLKDEHNASTSKITELIDLYPTIARLTGLDAPSYVQGQSMTPLLKNPNSKGWKKKEAFTISRKGGESLRTKEWRFTQYGHGELGFELYNLKADPGEFTNLANNPKYKNVLKKLCKRLNQKRLKAGYDPKVFYVKN